MEVLTPTEALDDALIPYRDVDRPSPADRPWVLANMVTGLDGSTAIDGRVGMLSSDTDRRLFLDLRSVADVVLVGAETARREHYGPVRLDAARRRERAARGAAGLPRMAIVSRSLSLEGAERALDPDSDPMVVTCDASPTERRVALESELEVVVAGSDRVEPLLALGELRARGAEVVLCEGGPALLGDLLTAGVVDELCLTVAPVVGGDPLPVAVMPSTASARTARLAHVLRDGDHLFLRYLFS